MIQFTDEPDCIADAANLAADLWETTRLIRLALDGLQTLCDGAGVPEYFDAAAIPVRQAMDTAKDLSELLERLCEQKREQMKPPPVCVMATNLETQP